MKIGFVTAIAHDLDLEQVLELAAETGFDVRRADVLAAREGRPPVRGRHPPRRRRLRRRRRGVDHGAAAQPRRRVLRRSATTRTRSTPTRREREVVTRTCRLVIDAAAVARRQRGQHLHRPRPHGLGRRQPRPLRGGLAAARRARRAAGVRHRDRELPDAVLDRRMAGRQEPRRLARGVAADVRDHPEPHLRPELRPVAPRLAAHRLRPRDPRVRRPRSSTSTPRTSGSMPDRLYSEGVLGPRLARPEAAGAGRRRLGRVLRGADRRRLPRPGVRRGRGSGLRVRARRSYAGAVVSHCARSSRSSADSGSSYSASWRERSPASSPAAARASIRGSRRAGARPQRQRPRRPSRSAGAGTGGCPRRRMSTSPSRTSLRPSPRRRSARRRRCRDPRP